MPNKMALPGRGIGWKEFLKNLKDEYTRDRIGDVAGSLTFFSVLAVFPFLLFLVALMSLVLDPAKAQEVVSQLSKVAPGQVTQILGERLKALASQNNVGLLTLGAAAALFSASSGIVALMTALNTVYGVEEKRPFWKVRGLAFLVTIGAAVFGILSALIALAAPAVAHWVGGPLGTAISWLRLPTAGVLMMFLWAVLYYVLPDVEQEFKFITPGSVVGVLIWVLASFGFSFYVSHFASYDATYGTLGGAIVLLMWMWISAQVLLIGAEINAIVEHKSPDGKGAGAKSKDEPAPRATKTEVEQSGGAVPGAPPGASLDKSLALAQARDGSPPRPRSGLGRRLLELALGTALVAGLYKLRR